MKSELWDESTGSMDVLLLLCSAVSGPAEEAISCAFSIDVLGSESLEGCGGVLLIAVAAPQT